DDVVEDVTGDGLGNLARPRDVEPGQPLVPGPFGVVGRILGDRRHGVVVTGGGGPRPARSGRSGPCCSHRYSSYWIMIMLISVVVPLGALRADAPFFTSP